MAERRKLENKKKALKENPEISQAEQEFLLNDFLKSSRRKAGITHEGTLYSYLRYAELIAEDLDKDLTDLQAGEELEEITDQVIDNIQDSVYKRGEGDLVKRNKNKAWTTWKRILKYQGVDTSNIPDSVTFTTDKDEADIQADTSPREIPTPSQFKDFLHRLGEYSSDKVARRNQAIAALIWDAGTRIGETLPLQMKQVHVNGDRLHISVEGNKSSSDRRIEIFQNKKLLLDYIQSHPKRDSPEAYLFPKLKEEKYFEQLDKKPLRRKVHQAASKLDFKTSGEPFHIFRKAMNTYYVVNDILSWEEVCERLGKSPDATMPTYLKMAMEDIDSSAAEGFGLDTDERKSEHRMKAPALLPQTCENCEMVNPGFREVCKGCQAELPSGSMPKGENVFDEDEVKLEKLKAQVEGFASALEELGEEPDINLDN